MESKCLRFLSVFCVSAVVVCSLFFLSFRVVSAPTFSSAFVLQGDVSWPRGMYPVDIDNDGEMEVFVLRQGWKNSVPFDTNPGYTGWIDNITTTRDFYSIDSKSGMTILGYDFDGDGYAECVVNRYRTGRLDVYNCNGNPYGVWTETNLISSGWSVGYAACLGDMDNDGYMDIIADAWGSQKIAWFRGFGDGSFSSAYTIASVSLVRGLAVGDLDGDGWLDVAFSYGNTYVKWYKNDGSPTVGDWGSAITVSTDCNGVTLSIGDVDGDGYNDIITPDYRSGGSVRWYKNNNGLGTSWSLNTVESGLTEVRKTVPHDIDGDGDMDIVACIETDPGVVKWYENLNGVGTSWLAHVLADDFVGYATDICVGDMDNDRDIDVLACDKGNTGTGTGAIDDGDFVWFEQEGEPTPPQPEVDTPSILSIGGYNYTAATVYDVTPEFIWTNVTNATGYRLQIASDVVFNTILIDLSGISEVSYPVEYSDNATEVTFVLPVAYSLSSYQEYFVRVSALY